MKSLILIPLLLLAAVPQDTVKPGLVGRYWRLTHEMTKFPMEVLRQDPQATRIDGMINFDSVEGRGFRDIPWIEYVAIEWKGVLRVPKNGDYTFFLRSMDGSRLFIDGKVVVDHDGRHTIKETASETVAMLAGDHDLRIEYFQNGMTRCILSWQHGDSGRQVIPSTALWHRPDKDVDKESR